MAKIALSTEKYVVHATISASGVVEKPDIVGAIFGQTEGLLGEELELRELQKSGRIGRIEVNVETKMGKSTARIEIPSSLSKQETALIAAAVKTIDRIGPCEATVRIDSVEDVRVSKREFIMEEAQKILQGMMSDADSVEISEKVKTGAREMKVLKYGRDKLDAGPGVEESEEIILVEGRADVLNLLRAGVNNAISVNGTSGPRSITDITKKKSSVIAFLDGDRGGDLILKTLEQIANIDYICRAPSGKEVEELPQKEILQCLRGKVAFTSTPQRGGRTAARSYERAPRRSPAPRRTSDTRRTASPSTGRAPDSRRSTYSSPRPRDSGRPSPRPRDSGRPSPRFSSGSRDFKPRGRYGSDRGDRGERVPMQKVSIDGSADYLKILDKMDGSHSAKLLDKGKKEIGEVPTRELRKVLTDIGKTEVFAIVIDGSISQEVVDIASTKKVSIIIGTRRNFSKRPSSMSIATRRDLQ